MPKPKIQSLILCDQAVQDRQTGKHTLVNVFNVILTNRIPVTKQEFFLYFAACDGVGEFNLALRIQYLGANGITTTFYNEGITLTLRDRLRPFEQSFRMHDIPFPSPGKYEVSLLLDDEVMNSTILYVLVRGGNQTQESQKEVV